MESAPARRHDFFPINRKLSAAFLFAITAIIVSCGGGGGGQSTQPINTTIKVTVSPATATLPVGTHQQFGAFVSGGTNTGVSWSASEGTIDQNGYYTAPTTLPAGTVTVTAALPGSALVKGSAVVTITNDTVTVAVSPGTATIKAGGSQRFTGTVGGTTNKVVTWSYEQTVGNINYSGLMSGSLFTAPDPIFSPQEYLITATSSADPTSSGSATLKVVPVPTQFQQSLPIKLGTSGINANVGDCCTGTLGSLLIDQDGKRYILSNNHILAKVDNGTAGDPIVQPGYVDTFCRSDTPTPVANFTFAPPITSNVDAAIAEVIAGAVDPSGAIMGLGGVNDDGTLVPAPPANTTTTATVGMIVAKTGRTTGFTCGTVQGIAATVRVDMPAGCGNPTSRTVTFTNQVIFNNLASAGDSGSLVVNAATAQPVAIVAAGSDSVTTGNPIDTVLAALNDGRDSKVSLVGVAPYAVDCSSPLAAVSTTSLAQPLIAKPQMISSALNAKRLHEERLMREPSILGVAVGISRGSTEPRILIIAEKGKAVPRVPSTIDGVPVAIITSGRIKAGLASANSSHRVSCAVR